MRQIARPSRTRGPARSAPRGRDDLGNRGEDLVLEPAAEPAVESALSRNNTWRTAAAHWSDSSTRAAALLHPCRTASRELLIAPEEAVTLTFQTWQMLTRIDRLHEVQLRWLRSRERQATSTPEEREIDSRRAFRGEETDSEPPLVAETVESTSNALPASPLRSPTRHWPPSNSHSIGEMESGTEPSDAPRHERRPRKCT